MTIDPNAVGATGEPRQIRWTSKDALLYAVGIGAGRDALAFSTENTIGTTQQVYPTFAIVAGMDSCDFSTSAMSKIGAFDAAMVVHGAQAVTLNGPIPPGGEAMLTEHVAAIYDKGASAVVVVETEATSASGDVLWTTASAAFIRGGGGFGGERGPSSGAVATPSREPDHLISLRTSPDQAYVYRLSGDRNPLHSDPVYASRSGFDTPILHGLCTYGFTGRALLRALTDDDVARFRHMEARFSAPVLPGETLDVRVWDSGAEAVFTTSVGERVVIDDGRVVYDALP